MYLVSGPCVPNYELSIQRSTDAVANQACKISFMLLKAFGVCLEREFDELCNKEFYDFTQVD